MCLLPVLVWWDHPRIRGEQIAKNFNDSLVVGSPPHTRGAALDPSKEKFLSGITPAYAGSSFAPSERRSDAGDHPRIRGEQLRLWLPVRWLTGITPAYAGSSL